MSVFRNPLGEHIFKQKYARFPEQTWGEKATETITDICATHFSATELMELSLAMHDFKWMPGGRYIYYSGRDAKFYNNCYLLRAEEDTREEWGALMNRASSCLMTGGGIGIDYSVLRERGSLLRRTGGQASGPIPLMFSINEIGRNVMQGGSRRSAIYASLNWRHPDAQEFLGVKNWDEMRIRDGYSIWDAKQDNFNYPAPLDMTNISLNYDDEFLRQTASGELPTTFLKNIEQALRTGEPGFSFNFGDKSNETLRNACTEVTSEDDSDVCNLGSINMARIESLEEFAKIVELATKFLVLGTLKAQLPYQKVHETREKNRRLGLGLMGIHEWLLMRGYGYEVVPELHEWLKVYRDVSKATADKFCDELGISRPAAYRAIAPTGTIGILAGTTTGIEPIYAVAYKRRYLTGSSHWKHEFVIDSTAKLIIDEYGINPDKIETAAALANDPEKRVRFQADIQDYVDMSISSTVNLPHWGSAVNNPDEVVPFARIVAKYAPRLRGLTVYPDGSRGGQPITEVPYADAVGKEGIQYDDYDPCNGGVCGI